MTGTEYFQKLLSLASAYTEPTEPPIDVAEIPPPHNMRPMVAYRSGNLAVCKHPAGEQQQAYNLVRAALPGSVGPDIRAWKWILLDASPSNHDPLGQWGYVGVKREKAAP